MNGTRQLRVVGVLGGERRAIASGRHDLATVVPNGIGPRGEWGLSWARGVDATYGRTSIERRTG